jgi:hypothetical protein
MFMRVISRRVFSRKSSYTVVEVFYVCPCDSKEERLQRAGM